MSGELTSGLIKGRWAQAARRHSSSITSSPIWGFPSSQVCQPPLGGHFLPAQAHGQVQVHQGFGELTANLEGACSLCSLSGQEGNSQSELHLTQGPATLGLLVAPQPRDPRSTSATTSPPSLLQDLVPHPAAGAGRGSGFFLSFFFFNYFLAMLGLHCCMGLFSSCS